MKPGKHFNQQQKLAVLASARTIGIKEAAVLAEIHYTTIYEWRRQVEALGEEAFLARKVASRGRGEKRITESQEKAILETWERHPGFGPGQVRNQLRRQGMTVSTRTVQRIMQAGGYQGKRKDSAAKEVQHSSQAKFITRRPFLQLKYRRRCEPSGIAHKWTIRRRPRQDSPSPPSKYFLRPFVQASCRRKKELSNLT